LFLHGTRVAGAFAQFLRYSYGPGPALPPV